MTELSQFTAEDTSRIIEMAWEDRTPFDAIHEQFGLSEVDVIRLMRQSLKPSSFRLWRERVTGRKTKHRGLMVHSPTRHRCATQGKFSLRKSNRQKRGKSSQ